MERKKLTREQAIEFCEDKARLHSLARDEIAKRFDVIEDEAARIKYNTHVNRINAYTDIAELLREG